jgi:invasion protein IalB
MVEAMRKGSDLTIKGMSGHGTESTDQFALKGLSQALERADQECK